MMKQEDPLEDLASGGTLGVFALTPEGESSQSMTRLGRVLLVRHQSTQTQSSSHAPLC
jgi:hypothetical protein